MQPLNIQGVAFHLGGKTSTGKSISCDCASSVFGGPPEDRRRHWDASAAGLEDFCAASCDQLIVMDELKQAKGIKNLSEAIYMISHGKPRMKHISKSQKQKNLRPWRLLMLSSGEVGIAEEIKKSGNVFGGQLVRLIEIQGRSSRDERI